MILCFTGCGNSRHVADILQDTLGDELVRFPPGLMRDPSKVNMQVYDGRVIWVFPVFGWGLPFGVKWSLEGANIFSNEPIVHHMVATCGDDIGYTDHQWRDMAHRRGWQTGSAFSVQMPNTFTFMRGFDVDSPEVIDAKMRAMPARVEDIARSISDGVTDRVDVVRGKYPWIKSKIIYPWFNHFFINTKRFSVTEACIGCGRCARNCPYSNITMVDNRPTWGNKCTLCSRCYNLCPTHAIDYNHATKGKGQYLCKGYTLIK